MLSGFALGRLPSSLEHDQTTIDRWRLRELAPRDVKARPALSEL
jgi:hypothetical protein